GLAGVPVEVLFAARGDTRQASPVVAYAPSASMFTYLTRAQEPESRPAVLLALGDPAYPDPKPDPPPPPPPDHGLLVVKGAPNGHRRPLGRKACRGSAGVGRPAAEGARRREARRRGGGPEEGAAEARAGGGDALGRGPRGPPGGPVRPPPRRADRRGAEGR